VKVLILGATGMLGHKLWQEFRNRHDTIVASRSSFRRYASLDYFDPDRWIEGTDVMDFNSVVRAMIVAKPDIVINSVGIIKQLSAANDPIASLSAPFRK